jgi:hypothetical protein
MNLFGIQLAADCTLSPFTTQHIAYMGHAATAPNLPLATGHVNVFHIYVAHASVA